MLYIIYQEDREDGAAIRAATRDAHFAYLDQHKDILVLGGALSARFYSGFSPAVLTTRAHRAYSVSSIF